MATFNKIFNKFTNVEQLDRNRWQHHLHVHLHIHLRDRLI